METDGEAAGTAALSGESHAISRALRYEMEIPRNIVGACRLRSRPEPCSPQARCNSQGRPSGSEIRTKRSLARIAALAGDAELGDSAAERAGMKAKPLIVFKPTTRVAESRRDRSFTPRNAGPLWTCRL